MLMRGRLKKVLTSDLVIAFVGVVIASAVTTFTGLMLAWIVYRDRYGVGLVDYLMLLFS